MGITLLILCFLYLHCISPTPPKHPGNTVTWVRSRNYHVTTIYRALSHNQPPNRFNIQPQHNPQPPSQGEGHLRPRPNQKPQRFSFQVTRPWHVDPRLSPSEPSLWEPILSRQCPRFSAKNRTPDPR